MKNNNLSTAFIIILAIGLVAVFWFMSNDSSFNWVELYRYQGKQPYDLKLVHDHLENQVGSSNFDIQDKSFEGQKLPKNGAYVFIGTQAFYDEYEIDSLLNWVKNGHTAFLAVKAIDNDLTSKFFDSLTCLPMLKGNTGYFYDTIVSTSLLHPEFKDKTASFEYIGFNGPENYDFGCFDGRLFCPNSPFQPLGLTQNTHVNFIRIPQGKGQILVHCSPVMFCNYYMTSYREAKYIQAVLSHINEKEIVWDEYHRHPHQDYNIENSGQGSTPLEFILEHKSLRWAFYLILSLALIYLIAATRRRQRIVKLIEPLRNSTLEFVQAMGRLYFLQRNHPTLIQMQMRYFLHFVRERYRVKARTPELIQLDILSQRSAIPKEQIQTIITEYTRLKAYVELSDAEAIAFHKLLNQFYKTCH
jgi:hypothetical protein